MTSREGPGLPVPESILVPETCPRMAFALQQFILHIPMKAPAGKCQPAHSTAHLYEILHQL